MIDVQRSALSRDLDNALIINGSSITVVPHRYSVLQMI